jgi:hypothetical protein
VAFFTLFTAVNIIIFIRITRVRIVEYFLEIILPFFLWMTDELASTSLRRLLFTLGGPEFESFDGGETFVRILFGVSS